MAVNADRSVVKVKNRVGRSLRMAFGSVVIRNFECDWPCACA